MEYLRATGAWMNDINRHIDDVVVKACIGERGRWQVSSMDWPSYFQVVGKSGKGLVGFVGDSASGTCEVWCQRVGQAHAAPTVSVEEIAECLDMPLEWAAIAITGMTAVVERGHAALSHYDGWTQRRPAAAGADDAARHDGGHRPGDRRRAPGAGKGGLHRPP